MRYVLRRLLILPLVLAFAAVVVVLLPAVGVVQAVGALGVVAGLAGGLCGCGFAAVYCAGGCLCVACLLLCWASPVPRRRDGDWWRERDVRVLSWYLDVLMRTAERAIAFRLTLECAARPSPRIVR